MSCCIKAQVATSWESVMCFNVFCSCYGTVSYGKFLVLRDVFPASFGMAEPFLVSPEKPGCQFPPIGEKETHQQQNSMENSSGRSFCAGGQHDAREEGWMGQGMRGPLRRSGFHLRVGHRFPVWAGARDLIPGAPCSCGQDKEASFPHSSLCTLSPRIVTCPRANQPAPGYGSKVIAQKLFRQRLFAAAESCSASHSEVLFGPWGSKVTHANK